MELLVFFILFPIATAAVHQFPLLWINSRENKSLRLQGREYDYRSADVNNIQHYNKMASGSPVINYAYLEYAIRVAIGSPPQEFTAALTLSAPILWVPHLSCKDEACKKRRKFDWSESDSFRMSSNSTESFRSSAGSATVLLGSDYVTLGALNEKTRVTPRMTFGLATKLKPLLNEDPFDGVFGLAFSNDLIPDIRPTIEQAFDLGVIHKLMFTVWLPPYRLTQGGAGGAITFGDVDNVNCGPILGYAPMTDSRFYMFEIKGVSMGIYEYKGRSEVTSELMGWIQGPKSVIENMAKVAGAKIFGTFDVVAFDVYVRVKFDEEDGIYEISCYARPPPILFFIGEDSYAVDYTDYIVKLETGQCMLALMPTENVYWVMGLPFIRSYCHVYEIDNRRIGFATPRPAVVPTPPPATSTRNPHIKGSVLPTPSFAMCILLFIYVLL